MAIKVDGVAVTGMAAGWPAAQELLPEADADLYRGWYDLTVLWPGGTSSTGSAAMPGVVNPGSGYKDGTASLVPLIGGSGAGATAELTFSGGKLTGVTLDNAGTNYKGGDILHFDNSTAGQGSEPYAGGALIQLLGTGVQLKDGGVDVKATTKPAATLTIEERLATMSRKEVEAFMVQEGLTRLNDDGTYSGGLDPASFRSLATLREAVAEAWNIVAGAKK